MIIKEINYDEKTSYFQIITDGDTIFYSSYEIYNELNLSSGLMLTDDAIKILKDFTNKQQYVGKIINFISYRSRTEKEIRNRIRKETSDESAIEDIISYLKSLNLIDDISFAKSYYENKRRLNYWSSNKIIYELKLKGIEDAKLEDFFDDIYSVDLDNARKLINKNINIWNKKFDKYKLKNKIYSFLSQKGFSYDIINVIFEEYVE